MAHYAFLDSNNVVAEVITGNDETTGDWETFYGEFRGQVCKRTSYSTYGGVHVKGGTPFRMNYAGIGGTYDPQRDAFIPKKPYSAWVLDDATLTWQPPFPKPDDAVINGGTKVYDWDEDTSNWKSVA
tara:strand:- start:503 stop:883 length:381 start_codon:yes stop_codon:yes gene_type:complete